MAHSFPHHLLEFVDEYQDLTYDYTGLSPVTENKASALFDYETGNTTPWLPLTLNFPRDEILAEARSVKHLFVPHRLDSGRGWHSLCIHGVAPDVTSRPEDHGYNSSSVSYIWTEIAKLCPVTYEYFKNVFPYLEYQRLRFMLVEPGGYINPHVDHNRPHIGAINISLNNPDGCKLVTEKGTVPFKDSGSIMCFNAGYKHCVINNSDYDRYHIIVHGAQKQPEFNNLVYNSMSVLV